MITNKTLAAILALTLASSAGVALADTAAGGMTKPGPTIEQQCKKEFGSNKAKVKKCVENKEKAAKDAKAPK